MAQAQNLANYDALRANDAMHTVGADVASATVVDLRATGGVVARITGSVTITGFTEQPAGPMRFIIFTSALTLTHNATSFILPGGASITTAANDTAQFVSLGSGNWKCIWYVLADGTILGVVPIPKGGTGQVTAVAGNDALHVASTDIASATTTDLSTATGGKVNVTGTTTITAFSSQTAGIVRRVTFSGALILTHDGTSLKLPGNENIVTAAGDRIEMVSLGSGNWEARNFERAAVVPYTSPDALQANVRLTLTSGVPITTTDVGESSVLYATPYQGNALPQYDGTAWNSVGFSEMSIKLTDTQTGTTTNGNAIVTGLTHTSQLCRGMLVTGTGIGVDAQIASIDSATQVTLTVNSTASASVSLTFKSTGTSSDIFSVMVNGAPALRINMWSTDTARADAISTLNSVYVNTSAINATDSNGIAAKQGTYLGTIGYSVTTGVAQDSKAYRSIWNNYNRVRRTLHVTDATDSWTYSTAAYRIANGDVASGNVVEVTIGLSEDPVEVEVYGLVKNSTSTVRTANVGIGINSTTNVATLYQRPGIINVSYSVSALYRGYPGIGSYQIQWLEIGAGADTQTWFGDAGGVTKSGMSGFVMG